MPQMMIYCENFAGCSLESYSVGILHWEVFVSVLQYLNFHSRILQDIEAVSEGFSSTSSGMSENSHHKYSEYSSGGGASQGECTKKGTYRREGIKVS